MIVSTAFAVGLVDAMAGCMVRETDRRWFPGRAGRVTTRACGFRSRAPLLIVACGVVACGAEFAFAQHCPPQPQCVGPAIQTITIGGSFGNAGFGTGYGTQVSRAAWGGGWCGQPIVPSCGPVVAPCGPQWCSPCRPWGGWSFGWPGCGIGGWYGRSRFFGSQSIFIAGSGGSFFSGGVVPWVGPWWYGGGPANWLPGCAITPFGVVCSPYATLLPPGVGPQFGPAAIFPFFGATSTPRVGAIASRQAGRIGVARPVAAASVVPPQRTPRSSTEAGRRRAASLVAAGDRQVREADGDPTKLRAALASYRRAESVERDSPDTFIRQAIIHAALGDRAASDGAIARAVALDARLGARIAVPSGTGDADTVFGDHGPATGPTAVAARGDAIIRMIAGDREAGEAGSLDRLARQWSDRWIEGLGGLAVTAR
jgi:hypothetical protein